MRDKGSKVSVVISTFNRAKYLTRSVKSVLAQTFNDYELIIVDDASTDNTREVVSGFDDARIRYIRHEANKGGPAARNSGIKAARGEYVALLDDDDEWKPEKLALQVKKMEAIPESVGVVYCAAEVREETGNELVEIYYPDYTGDLRKHLLSGPVIGGVSKVLIRKKCFEKAGLFDEALKSCQDWDMWLRISEHYKFDFVPKVLVTIYLHKDQISDDFRKLIPGRTAMLGKHYDEFRKHPEKLVIHLKRMGKLHFINGTWKEGIRWFAKAIKVNKAEALKIIAWLVLEMPRVKFFSRQRDFTKFRNERI